MLESEANREKSSFYKKWWFWVGVVLAVAIILGLIVDGKENNVRQQEQVDNVVDSNQESVSRCQDVSDEALSWIEGGLISDSLSLNDAQAVRSRDFSELYFVSAYLSGEGLVEDRIATFGAISIEDSGFVLAVNPYAKEFSEWLHGDREGAEYYVTMSDDGARESRDCLSR